MFFEGLAGCVHKRERYQQNIENDTNIHDKSMLNQYSENDTKHLTTHHKMNQHGSQYLTKSIKTNVPKPMQQKKVHRQRRKEVWRLGRQPLLRLKHLFFVS